MKKQLILMTLGLLLIGLVSAIPSPHGFYGNVYYSDGNTLLGDGYSVIAKINGGEVGSSEIVSGSYDLVVESDSGGNIYFYVNGETVGSETFKTFEVTEKDFTTSIVIPTDSEDSGDNSNSNNNPGGGSPGGGSSGSSSSPSSGSTIILGVVENNETTYTTLGNSDEAQEGYNEREISGGWGFGITGAAIGFLSSKNGVGVIFIILVILGAGLVVIDKRKMQRK